MLGVRIPLGTAFVEEVVFRGVLLGAFLGEGTVVALIVTSATFGLWHIAPTALLVDANRLRGVVVPAGVVATGVAGAFLGWLRVETGSIAAPFVLHALVNALGGGAAMIAHSLHRRSGG